jgi:nicotinamidase-related amidase
MTQDQGSQTSVQAGKVHYAVNPRDTALISIDFQTGFGDNAWEPVPYAAAALENFRRAAQAWRSAGGLVLHVHTFFTPVYPPGGRMTDFAPDIANALERDAPAAQFYPGLVEAGDVLVHKTNFSAVAGGTLLDELKRRQLTTAVLGGLTTPICVQTTRADHGRCAEHGRN